MSQYETIQFELKNRVAVINLNRPDAANGLNTVVADELLEVSSQCKNDGNIKAALLTAGGNFSAPVAISAKWLNR